MGKVQKVARLHEKTVQKIADNAVMVYRKPRKAATRSRNSKVVTSHWYDGVDPLIVNWVRQNKIYYKRVEVVSSDVVIIHNPGEKW